MKLYFLAARFHLAARFRVKKGGRHQDRPFFCHLMANALPKVYEPGPSRPLKSTPSAAGGMVTV